MIFFTAIGMFAVGVLGVCFLGILVLFVWNTGKIVRVKELKRLKKRNKKLRENIRTLGKLYNELKKFNK